MNPITTFYRWLHGQWPAGQTEKMPKVEEGGLTDLRGVRVVGDLTGVPLLKFSADTGAKAIAAFLAEDDFRPGAHAGVLDVAIIGAGVSGISAAIEARKAGLKFAIYESQESFSTIRNFPRHKPIYAYPSDMEPAGEMRFQAEVKEALLTELEEQRTAHGIEPETAHIDHVARRGDMLELTFKQGREPVKAQRVIIAIGRTGNFRKLNVPGENLDKVSNRLIDAREFSGQRVLVVGGGDSALEAAISLVEEGAEVTLSYRGAEFKRPKPENIECVHRFAKAGQLRLMLGSNVQDISDGHVLLCDARDEDVKLANEQVFILVGREPPLDFFRKSGISIINERNAKFWLTMAGMFIFVLVMYHWQKGMWLQETLSPKPLAWWVSSLGGWLQAQVDSPRNFLHHLRAAMDQPGFYYSLAYSLLVVIFGIRRVRRRRTPYVKLQTTALAAFQVLPLFLLPWILLPWAGANGWFDSGFGKTIGDAFWPDGSYWRAFGLILAWPLFVYNWFTAEPLWGWLILGFLQTFVLIPFLVWRWGKGAYCGWICSCGALAETLGDQHRHKMPHGPAWNKLNMLGQVVLWVAIVMMVFRILGWIFPESFFGWLFGLMLSNKLMLDYKYLVDFWLAGVLGVAFYFHFSGRVWCRFACPLAALMHIYARFSRFRIFAHKKKCISCNACTSICHQGIDIMNFANKGLPMEDPECVRCSACVQICPTGTLSFGRYDAQGQPHLDRLWASPVQMSEAAHANTPIDDYLAQAAEKVQ